MGVVAVAEARPASLARRLECFPYQHSQCRKNWSVLGLCATEMPSVNEIPPEVSP
jgi:hypothetical protein